MVGFQSRTHYRRWVYESERTDKAGFVGSLLSTTRRRLSIAGVGRLFDDLMDKKENPRLIHLVGQYPEFYEQIREALESGGSPTGKRLLETDPDGPDYFVQKLLRSKVCDLDTSNFLEDFSGSPSLDDAVVFSVNNVARYYIDHAQSEDLYDFLPTYAPPFKKFWIEYDTGQDLPSLGGHQRVGILFNGYDHSEADWHPDDDPDDWRWSLEAFVYLEVGGRVAGPFFCWRSFVAADGSVFKENLELPACELFGDFSDEVWSRLKSSLMQQARDVYRPALLALGFLHCKNVEKVEHDPPPLSRKQRRGNRSAKSRYYTLDIEAMRKVLKTDGQVEHNGLGHALHICRGHFKTFSPEAPLMGKGVGTYWWQSHVRGNGQYGTVVKDYQVHLGEIDVGTTLGLPWQILNEQVSVSPAMPNSRDVEKSSVALNTHSGILNRFADYLESYSISARRPTPSEPQFDLAWESATVINVLEAKSITVSNEEEQLRKALGQVKRYSWHVRKMFPDREIRLFVLVSEKPIQENWIDTMTSESVTLLWPALLEVQNPMWTPLG